MKKYKRNKNERQYVPRHCEKYCGTYPIICRSSWEYRMCEWLDYNSKVTKWSSENHRIPYFDPVHNRKRIYYPDFYVRYNDGGEYIVEVKPLKDCRLPIKKGGKSDKTMAIREQTFLINRAKFKAATEYCKKLGMKFAVITEKNLFRGNK